MGVGKTTVGEILARKLGIPFLDADKEIEKSQGLPVTEIFRTRGEKAFREIEKEQIVEWCARPDPKVLSLGGGAFLQEEIREACLRHALVFHLSLSWEAWKSRYLQLVDTRPVLQGKTLGEIEALFRKREETYRFSHWTLRTDDVSPEEAADRILDIARGRGDAV